LSPAQSDAQQRRSRRYLQRPHAERGDGSGDIQNPESPMASGIWQLGSVPQCRHHRLPPLGKSTRPRLIPLHPMAGKSNGRRAGYAKKDAPSLHNHWNPAALQIG
jgi:hypothetical protein